MTPLRALSIAVSLLLAATAMAASSTPALGPATIRVRPNDGSKQAGEVKKGDALTVIQTKGLWTEIETPGGQHGWVPTRIVVATEAPAGVDVTAAEGSTAIAIRECPVRQALVIGGRGLPREISERVGAGLAASGTVAVLETRYEAADGPGSAVEKVPGSIAGKTLDVVVRLAAGEGNALTWDVVAIKKRAILASGKTPPSSDVAAPAEMVVGTLLFHLEHASHETHHQAPAN